MSLILPAGAIETKEGDGPAKQGDTVLYRIPDGKSGKQRLRPGLVVTTHGTGKEFACTLLVTLDMFKDVDLDPTMMQHGYKLMLIAIGQGAVEYAKQGTEVGTWRLKG